VSNEVTWVIRRINNEGVQTGIQDFPRRWTTVIKHNGDYIGPVRPGTHYLHVTWAHVMLRVHLGYFNIEFWRKLTPLSLCLRHVIRRGALVGSRASTLLKFLLSHTFRGTWRTCRVLFNIVTICFQKWRKCLLKIAPTDLFMQHHVTRL
jgi:hypothetical protein